MKRTRPLFLFFLTITSLPLYGMDTREAQHTKNVKVDIADLSYFDEANYTHIQKYLPSIVIPKLKSYNPNKYIAQCRLISNIGTNTYTLYMKDRHIYAYYTRPIIGSYIYILKNMAFHSVTQSELEAFTDALNPFNGITYTQLIAANKEIQKLHDAPLLKNQYLTISCDRGLSTYTVSANCMSVTLDEKKTRISRQPRISPDKSVLELLLTSWSGDSRDIIIKTVTHQSRCAIL
jgi:hypothetical protein